MKQLRGRLLIVSMAALLAGTAMAAGQGATERKEQPGASQGQPSQAQPKGAQREQLGQKRESQGQQRGNQPQGQQQGQRPSTTGQAPRGEEQNRAQDNQRDQNRTQGQTERNQDLNRTQGQDQREERTQGQNREQRGEREGGRSGAPVTLTTEQRSKIRQTVLGARGVPRASKLDFSVNVGMVVPRSVRVVTVPETIIEIHPEWRGYRYFVYSDEIIIVEPDTLRIVAVIEV